eukprot:8260466-Pyramimonas_sp.AAC.1
MHGSKESEYATGLEVTRLQCFDIVVREGLYRTGNTPWLLLRPNYIGPVASYAPRPTLYSDRDS